MAESITMLMLWATWANSRNELPSLKDLWPWNFSGFLVVLGRINTVLMLLIRFTEESHSPRTGTVLDLRQRQSDGLYEKRMTSRAHSFPRNFEPSWGICFFLRNWAAEFYRRIRLFPAEFDVFHSNNYFFTENDLKLALLQVCLWWFFVWWWWLNDENDD